MALTKATNRMMSGADTNVLDFGAIGDGITNDTVAIQAAINEGNSIQFPNTASNIYLINDTLTIGSNTALIFSDNVTVKMDAGVNKKMVINKDATNVNISIYGGIFDINETNQTIQTPCIRFDNLDNSYFERIEIKPTHFQAYVGEGSWHLLNCDNNVIRDCILKDSADEGLYIIGDDNKIIGGEYSDCTNGSGIQQSGARCLIDGVTANNNTGSSIGIAGTGSKVTNCTVSGGGQVGAQGIRIGHSGGYPADDAIVSGNRVLNFDGARGIGLAESNNVVISNNLVEGCTRTSSMGIGGGSNSTNITVTGNRVVGCYYGYSFAIRSVIIIGNIAEGNLYRGIDVSISIGNTIANNICRNNANEGMFLGAGTLNNLVIGNGCYDDADADGIFTINTVAGAGALTLAGALVAGTVATMNHARRIVILSSGNDSGITFTVTGTDPDDAVLVEVITGGNATTANSTGRFKSITSIVSSGAAAANVTIGELTVQTRGIHVGVNDGENLISSNYCYGNITAQLTTNVGTEGVGNRASLTDRPVVDQTLVAGAGGTTVTNGNIVLGSRIVLVPSSSGTPPREIYLASQTTGSCVIGALAGGAADTIKLYIN
jgi:parallel beta-helix repeat protein